MNPPASAIPITARILPVHRTLADSSDLYCRLQRPAVRATRVDPLTAEGIYSAVVSGQAAARAIVDALGDRDREGGVSCGNVAVGRAAASYELALKPLRELLAFSGRAARAFYANPDRGFQALTLPGLRTALLRTYAEGVSSGMLLRILQRWPAA